MQIAVGSTDLSNAPDVAHTIDAFAAATGGVGGLIVLPSTLTISNMGTIVAAAERNRLPAVYPFRFWAIAGGLAAYGPDQPDQFRRAATYADRILRGEKPGDLPIQAATKFDLVINLKAAKGIGLDVPATLLVRADAVIE